MSKLRLFSERRSERNESATGVDTDLRGLANDTLVKESVNFGQLTLTHLDSTHEALIQDTIARFGLKTFEEHHENAPKNHHHFVVRNHLDGQHKAHSVVLFSALLYLHEKAPEVSAHLGTVQGLHWNLEKGIKGHATHHSPEAHVKTWSPVQGTLAIEESCTQHLVQAGFPVSRSTGYSTMDSKTLHECFHSVTQQTHSLRKVG